MQTTRPKSAQETRDETMSQIQPGIDALASWCARYGADEAHWGHVATARRVWFLLDKVLDAISAPIED